MPQVRMSSDGKRRRAKRFHRLQLAMRVQRLCVSGIPSALPGSTACSKWQSTHGRPVPIL